MKSLKERAKKEIVEIPISIPSPDGSKVVEIVKIKVEALKDPQDGEIYLTSEAIRIIEKTKARYMGILLPTEIRELRGRLGMTQQGMSQLLRIGDKTYTRWENGRKRPSQSLNLLLTALWDGKLDVNDLIRRHRPSPNLENSLFAAYKYNPISKPFLIKVRNNNWEPQEDEALAATA